MGQRGRKSTNELSVVKDSPVQATQRPEPPDDLSAEQAEEWTRIVNRMPAEWFPEETWGLLAQYVRHLTSSRRVAYMIRQWEVADPEERSIDDYDKLLKMQEREGRAMSSLATRMRITQQATYHPEKSKGSKKGGKKPWEH